MPLLMSVLSSLKFSQPFRKFLNELLMLLLMVPGRATFRNLSRYSAYDEKTFSRWYRREVDWAGVNVAAIRAVVPATHESVFAFDPSHMAKSGARTEGIGSFWNGCAGRAERGLEVNVLSWVDVTTNTAYTISAALTPPKVTADPATTPDTTTTPDTVSLSGSSSAHSPSPRRRTSPKAKGQAKPRAKPKAKPKAKVPKRPDEPSRIDAYLAHLKQVITGGQLALLLRYLVADGFFSKIKFVDGILALNLHLISKLRSDADARYRYTGPYGGRGAPRRYGDKVNWNILNPAVFTSVASTDPTLTLHTALVALPHLKRNVRVVVVTETRTGRRALLFSTDVDLDPVTLYRYYKARFQIEFLFRVSKQYAGLTHCQARCRAAITFQVNASLTAVSLSKLQAIQAAGEFPQPFSMASVVRRAFNVHFLKKIIAYLAQGQTLTEISPEYETLCNYGIINSVPT